MWNAIVDEKYIKRTHILIENIYNVLSKIELFNNDYTQYESNNLIPGSLSKGTIGPALFFYYFDKSFNTNKSKHLISKFGTHSINTLANPWISTTLFEGSIGILWAIDLLTEEYGTNIKNITNLDNKLLYILENSLINHYDLIGGYIGYGFHFLRKPLNPLTIKGLNIILDKLNKDASYNSEGIFWQTKPEFTSFENNLVFPNGYIDLGLAHGMPAVIIFLTKIIQKGINTKLAYKLLRGSIQYIQNKSSNNCWGNKSKFPYKIDKIISTIDTKFGWCYGDIGIGLSLFHAANIMHDNKLRLYALNIILETTRRKLETIQEFNACLCHGSAGLMHIYNRLYQLIGEAKLKRQANYWLKRTLEYFEKEEFNNIILKDNKIVWSNELGFLTGISGVGLGLLASLRPVAPDWDKMMILS